MNDEGLVLGVEHITDLYNLGIYNISKSHSDLIKQNKIILLNQDGRQGEEYYKPYNCIHVGAGKFKMI